MTYIDMDAGFKYQVRDDLEKVMGYIVFIYQYNQFMYYSLNGIMHTEYQMNDIGKKINELNAQTK